MPFVNLARNSTSVGFRKKKSVAAGLPNIGAAYGGGYFAGQINVSGTVYKLVVADKTVGEVFGKKYGPIAVNTGVTSVIAGPTNSATLAALGASYEAAIFCENLNTGGFTDWYLPALKRDPHKEYLEGHSFYLVDNYLLCLIFEFENSIFIK
jgi:hypothetical protein